MTQTQVVSIAFILAPDDLLPNENLSLAPDGSGAVLLNGKSTQGLSNRKKILAKAVAGRG